MESRSRLGIVGTFMALTGTTFLAQNLIKRISESPPAPIVEVRREISTEVTENFGRTDSRDPVDGSPYVLRPGSTMAEPIPDAGEDFDAGIQDLSKEGALASDRALASLEKIKLAIHKNFGPNIEVGRQFDCDDDCINAFISGPGISPIGFHIELDGTFTIVGIEIAGMQYPEQNVGSVGEIIEILDERMAAFK